LITHLLFSCNIVAQQIQLLIILTVRIRNSSAS
jgi:hypothetical protein